MSKHDLTIGGLGSEARARRLKRSALMLSAAVFAIAVHNPARAQDAGALPTNGTVVGGSATIAPPSGSALTITQNTPRAVINWESFDIGSAASVAFVQPSTTAIAVNRVTSGVAPSQIAGTLTANGVVAILNPNGVMFSGSANVDVGGLIASTANIDDAGFMAGNSQLAFTGAGSNEIVVSAGANISVRDMGLAAFVAPSVRNSGTITANAGRVALGSGNVFTLDLAGDRLLEIGVGSSSALVENHGTIFANGGRIQMSAKTAGALINSVINTNVLSVGSASLDGSTIVLEAAGGNVQLGGAVTGKLAVTASHDVEVASNLNVGSGAATLTGQRIFGAGDINVASGALTLNVNNGALADTTAGNWIGDALGVIGNVSGAKTVNLGAGVYAAGATIGTNNVTVNGGGVATIRVPLTGSQINGLNVNASGDGAMITGINFAGTLPVGVAAWNYGWASGSEVTRGVAIADGANGVTVSGNTLSGLRNGILLDGRNIASVTITGNTIDNTKSAISVQYVDASASGFNISGNSQGAFGNEWGIILHLNGIWNGSTTSPSGGALGPNTPLLEQARLLALSNANNGLSVYNQAYSASNRTHVNVAVTGGASAQGSVATPISSVQGGVNAVVAGGTVSVRPGDYTEGVTGVDYFGGAGGQQFGLYVAKDNVTIRGVDANGQAITNADQVAAFITARYQAGFGAQHFVSGTGVTIEGLGFKPAAGGDNKTFEVIGDDFTLRNSVIDNRGNQTVGNFYISTFDTPGADVVESFTLENNIFYGAAYSDPVSRGIVTVAAGVGRNSDSSNRIFSGNRLIGATPGQIGIQVRGIIPSLISYQAMKSGAVDITGNSFDVDIPVRSWGELSEGLAWSDIFYGNTFVGGAVLAFVGDTDTARAVLLNGNEEEIRITRRISESVVRAQAGDTVRMLDGTYNLGTSQLVIDRGITLLGQSETGTIIDGRAVSANGLGTISVLADNTTLGNFTLYGSEQTLGNYGIKVQPNPAGHVNTAGGDTQRINNVAIHDVTVRGSRRAELDINGAVGVTVTNFTADGRRVVDGAATEGAGVQITDSANVTLSGVTTHDNLWGGVALYQKNSASGYNGQTTNINIDASQNSFAEAQGLFSQLESTTQGFGQLNLTGFDYAVRNTDHRPDNLDGQFIFYRSGLADALDFALHVGTASASSIEGYSGTTLTNSFTVADGLSIGAAMRDVRTGGTVNVGAGTYAETVAITKSLTLDGAGMNATAITGGITISGSLADLVLSDFAVSGSGNGTSVIGNTGTLTGLTVSGVRIDGGNVADRHGFIGGQIGGAIAITGSEFVNIRGWAAFDTRSGAGGNDGAQIASAIFSGNLIDNTIGHIAFRQQIGAATLPNVTISGNTVRNVGNATNSFGAIFKAFNAGTVNFTGNTVSDIGTSGFLPSGEAAYGAALMTRGVATLNVIGNSFTNNNQVFAVEPNRGLPTVTNFIGNSFVNNGYAIYLPTSFSGGGTIQFGAGNDFVSGARTVQHIVWRSGAALDLTQASFDGVQTADMSLTQLFAVADLISDGIDRAGAGLATLVGGNLYVTAASGSDSIRRAVALATAGDTVNLSAGTHVIANTLLLDKGLSILGQGKGLTTIDASGYSAGSFKVQADNSTLAGFTLLASGANVASAYGIKVEAGNGNPLNENFAIRDVAISGSRKTGLDLNSVVGATIDGVTVTGVIAGNGIAITDSADVTVRNTATSGNAWGGLALYQTNNLGGGGSVLQLTDITIEGNNSFGETNGLYLEDSSALRDPGTLNIQGFDFTVRNAAYGSGFTFFRTAVQDALNYAVNLAPALSDSSVVQGWTGTGDSGEFVVGFGSLDAGGLKALSLQTAFDASADGASIYVGSGIYGQTATLNGARALTFADATLDGLTLTGDGTTIGGTLTSTGALSFGDVALNDATSLTAAGNLSVGGVTGAYGLSLSGGAITLGFADVASLSAAGTSIVTDGAKTTGAQSFTGATTLGGTYSASDFAVNGAATLADATSISGDAVTLGTVEGAHALTIDAGGAVVLGAASGLASLDVTGAAIASAGATTSGAQAYSGATTLSGDYAAASFAVTGATTLGGDTGISGGGVTLRAVGGAHALVIGSSGAVALGAAELASLDVTGTTIATVGSTTSGAQRYAGATTLGGTYQAGSFTVAGATTLAGDSSITATSASLGTVGGAHGLAIDVSGAVALGAATGLTSLDVTGATIATVGNTTSGAQRYTGATTLDGDYAAASFAVTGAATLAGDTSLAGGEVTLGTIGGANALTIAATGDVVLGAVQGLTDLSVAGGTIATAGASTTGLQSYSGPTLLGGAYSAAALAVNGAALLGGDTSISGGSVTLGTIGGARALVIDATGAVTLGAASGLASLDVTGATIATVGSTTSGAQRYAGATTLAGSYDAGSFAVTGATTLAGDTAIDADSVALATVGGAHALTIDASGAIALGAAQGLASLTASGATIATSGVGTSGAQRYSGATSLNGAYTAASFDVAGAATLAGATTVATGGKASFGAIGGANSLGVTASSAALGAVNGLTSLTVTAADIATAGAATTGAQSYSGATSLNGAYTTGGAGFTVTGAATLGGATSVTSGNGAISFGAVNGVGTGGQGFTLNAGTGSATLGALGAAVRLGAVSVNSGQTVLGGATLRGASLTFTGGTGATVRLTQATTTFATSGGAISIQPNLIGTTNAAQNVVFSAGAGDIAIGNVGTDAIRLGSMTVDGHNFSAQTVKLAGDYVSTLSGSQVFSANTLDTLASVRAVVAGSESGPIRAGGAVTIDAGASGTGSIIAGGPVSLGYTESVSRAVTSTGPVTIESGGAISGTIVSGGAVSLGTVTGAITSNVNASGPVSVGTSGGNIAATIVATGPVSVASTSGTIGGSINTSGAVTIASTTGTIAPVVSAGGPTSVSSTSGAVGGSITSTGAVTIATTSGAIASVVNAGGETSVSSASGSVGGSITSTGPISVTTDGTISGTYSGGGAITLTSDRPVNVQVNGSVVTVQAPGGTVTGVFNEIKTDSGGTFVVNDAPVIGKGTTDARQIIIDSFLVPVGATIGANGEIELPVGLALGLIAPAGRGEGQRPPVVVNNVARLGELLRIGYTAIIIDLDESNVDVEEELVGSGQQ